MFERTGSFIIKTEVPIKDWRAFFMAVRSKIGSLERLPTRDEAKAAIGKIYPDLSGDTLSFVVDEYLKDEQATAERADTEGVSENQNEFSRCDDEKLKKTIQSLEIGLAAARLTDPSYAPELEERLNLAKEELNSRSSKNKSANF